MTAEQIYRQWHEAAKSRNTAALLALYHEAAELESPLVPIILNQNSGVCTAKPKSAASSKKAPAAAPTNGCAGIAAANTLPAATSSCGNTRAKRPMASKSTF